jgi:hypothetical protein
LNGFQAPSWAELLFPGRIISAEPMRDGHAALISKTEV